LLHQLATKSVASSPSLKSEWKKRLDRFRLSSECGICYRDIFCFISQHKTSATCIYCAQAGQISLATNVTASGF